jgi:exodeoxyribonuclease VII large subunit
VIIVGRGGGSLEDLWPFNEEIVARAIFHSEIPVVSAVGHEVDFSISDFVADFRAPTPSAAAELVVPERNELKGMLSNYIQSMYSMLAENVRYNRQKLAAIAKSYAFRQPVDLVRQFSQRLDEIDRSLDRSITHKVEIDQQKLQSFEKRLLLLEHRNVLKRGYSLCYRQSDGRLVNSSHLLSTKDKIAVEFHQGKVLGAVEEIIE